LERIAEVFRPAYWGILLVCLSAAVYLLGVAVNALHWILPFWNEPLSKAGVTLVWYAGVPLSVGMIFGLLDLFLFLPLRRRQSTRLETETDMNAQVTVVLTAYNDQDSIAQAVADFRKNPRVKRVVVVDNNSKDGTAEAATAAGAVTVIENKPGYGRCVYRCLLEGMSYEDTPYVLLCEGDRTFRADDVYKFLAYIPHADIVNGTRIVEQLRCEQTQLTTFMYYGNFFVGKLLEVKHLGRGTFTDVGTTYKMIRRDVLPRLLDRLDPAVNLEFNAHFMDRALHHGFALVECPVTFHPRVGESKGGNVNNGRAIKVGLRMMLGLTFGWRFGRQG
jgi:hypothetical protein